ncbi:mannose-1-phosphate guanylyltransferase [Cohnella nanjingensis]|uniref:Mannose-1-phosphate guanylyltransferase n=1 Tax=Cohnella nanjingensis TaxID=1387779 RepID=A0A7X0RWP6_9BACL|nr:sugar phosphate nucleotidyltransferase [Cohnella nanjingensis]MBB6675006.1 mannose-1-phosphate guanylyltransferase [Cohnella nanjingensis]
MNIVIMAGGKGHRLWPHSAGGKPKQFLALTAEETMLQLTYRRLARFVAPPRLYVATAAAYVGLVREQLPELDPDRIITEPVQRDTGPCVALSALHFLRKKDDDVLIMIPSDQHIPDTGALASALEEAEAIAGVGRSIVTLGVVPNRPETNYGYMQADANDRLGSAYRVARFIEKPDADRAEALIHTPNTYWNCGIFAWRPSTIAAEMQAHQPGMWSRLAGAGEEWEAVYAELPKISVDYAILEKAKRVYTIPVDFEWDDMGRWTSLERVLNKDAHGNIVQGTVRAVASADNIIVGDQTRTVVIGVRDLIIVSTAEGLLVCHKSKEPLLKQIVQQLESEEEAPALADE